MRVAGGSDAAAVPIWTIASDSGPLPPIAARWSAVRLADGTSVSTVSAVPPSRVAISR